MPAFDLVIADEAHRCAGTPDAAFAVVLDERGIHAHRRLFFTATPRYASARLKLEAGRTDLDLASMDDEQRFGPVLYQLGFAEAIDKRLLTDYQVVVVVVDREGYRELVERGACVEVDGGTSRDARTLAAQIGLAIAMRNYDLRRVVSFHSRVSWARAFAQTLPAVVQSLPARKRPSGVLRCSHVHGAMPTDQRVARLSELRSIDRGQRGVITNARCLTEGIDVPTLDGVAFVDPRRSQTDIVQAVGRAIRKADGKKLGTIVLPVFVSATADDVEAIEDSAFAHVWQVLRALRAHDEVLGAELDELRREIGRRGSTSRLPRKLEVIGPYRVGKGFLRGFDTRVVEQSTRAWEFWFGLLEAFVIRMGHSRVPSSYLARDDLDLGRWVIEQRSRRWAMPMADQARLEALPGWTWNARVSSWDAGFRELSAFVSHRGHAQVPQRHVTGSGFKLGAWVTSQRGKREKLSEDRRTRLAALPGWRWEMRESVWEERFAAVEAFARANGHVRIPRQEGNSFLLGSWIVIQRQKKTAGTLSAERQRRLAALPGWSWNPVTDAWDRGFRQLEAFVKRKGHARVPASYTTRAGFKLGSWVSGQRSRKSSLSPLQRTKLVALAGWTWNPLEEAWEAAFERLRVFQKANGHSRVPYAFATRDGFNLGGWVNTQRSRRARLSKDRQRRLASLKGWTWQGRAAVWEDGLRHLKEFARSEGHARVPVNHTTTDGFNLGTWVVTQRRLSLSSDRRARLEAVRGWSWENTLDAAWDRTFEALVAFVKKSGHAAVPQSHVTRDGIRLGVWVAKQRGKRAILPAARRKRLAELPGWSWGLRTKRSRSPG